MERVLETRLPAEKMISTMLSNRFRLTDATRFYMKVILEN